MSSKKTIISLDIARGIAAVLVFISHIRAFLFVDFGQSTQKGILAQAFYFITSLGHEAVMIFFVLSGFLISGSVQKSFQKLNFTWKIYLTNRLTRLYVVCVPALFLTLLWDKLGIFYTNSPYYQGGFGNILAIAPDVPVNLSVGVFAQSILFLQTITAPIFGTNGAMWSLAYEFWYYIAFPLAMIAYIGFKNNKILNIVFALVLLISFLVFFPADIVLGFGIWLFGYVAYRLAYIERLIYLFNSTIIRVITLFILAVCIFFSAYIKMNEWLSGYVVGIAYTLVLLSFLNFEMKESFVRRTVQFFSDISYTLYLVHMPVMIFTVSYFFNNERFGFTVIPILTFCAYFVGVVIYSYIMYLLFEKRTPQFRNWVLDKIIKK